jgi:hypothetical protein
MPRSLLLGVVLTVGFAQIASAGAPFYTPLPPAYPLFGISGDGQRPLGMGLGMSDSSRPGYWEGLPPGGPIPTSFVPMQQDLLADTYVTARFASFDGSTIAGESFPADTFGSLGSDPTGGYRWNAIDGVTWLPGFDTPPTRLAGISPDGSTIFGIAAGKAARWDAGVLTILTPPTHPGGMPATLLAERPDGRWIGAASPDAAGSVPPLFLTDGIGIEPLWVPEVGDLHATRASADGGVVVGSFTDSRGMEFPFRWSDHPLPQFAQLTERPIDARAHGVSADGNAVVGRHDSTVHPSEAFVWTPLAGLRDLRDVLEDAGFPQVPLYLNPLWSADDVSSDGSIVIGIRRYFDGFIAGLPQPVPEPGSCAVALAALFALLGLGRLHSTS